MMISEKPFVSLNKYQTKDGWHVEDQYEETVCGDCVTVRIMRMSDDHVFAYLDWCDCTGLKCRITELGACSVDHAKRLVREVFRRAEARGCLRNGHSLNGW